MPGSCTELLENILAALEGGLYIRDESQLPTLLAREDGRLAIIEHILSSFDFDEDKKLQVNAELNASEIKIGGVELEDAESGYRANVEADGTKGALYVQSKSLLNKTDYDTGVGDIVTSLSTTNSEISNVKLVLDNIKTDTGKLKFTGDDLLVLSNITNDVNRLLGKVSITGIDAGTTGILENIVDNTSLLTISNIELYSGNITFTAGLANRVKTISNITQPVNLKRIYAIEVLNPSTESDFDIQIYAKETFDLGSGPETKWLKLGTNSLFTVPKSPDVTNPDEAGQISGLYQQIQGAHLAQGIGISFTNKDELIETETTLFLKIREAD